MARRYLRTASYLMRYNQVWLPSTLRTTNQTEAVAAYLTEQWPIWREKWIKAGAWEAALAPENPLGIWRDCTQSVLNISLPL